MEIFYEIEKIKLKSSVITIGSYDGIHRGHFHIINKVNSISNQLNTSSVVITFDPHPRNLIGNPKEKVKLLMSLDKKIELIKSFSIDYLVILKFDMNLMNMDAEVFLKKVIIKNFNPRCIVSGINHTFGHNRSGDIKYLKKFCTANSIALEVVEPLVDGEMIISSTNIRNLIENGFIRRANYELGSFYGFYAKVISGSGRGKKLQYPTANLLPVEKDQLLPKIGVYLTRCIINGLSHYGMCNFGIRPTFGENDLVLEVHLFDEKLNDFYDDCIWVEFLERIRDEIKFSSVEELIEQLEKDKSNCLSLKSKYELGEEDAYNQGR